MRFFLFTLMFALFVPVVSAALPGQMQLKYGYQMYILPTRDKNLWAEYEKYYYEGQEVQLSQEERETLGEKLEKKVVRGVDRAYIAQFLKEYIEPKLNQEQGEAVLTLVDNRVVIDGSIQRGETLNIPVTVRLIEKALKEKIDEVDLAVDVEDPKMQLSQDLRLLGLQKIVAVGESNFEGSSEARVHNIRTAMKQYEGYLVKPGEVFSFNELLGEVDGTTGYKKELVIKGPETIPEWGGGVCQVSSTLYRSVMLSGLSIKERANHSYSVDYYYPHGSDATIYPGVRDFRFENTTDYALSIHSYIKGEKLYFILLGNDAHRSDVALFGPYIHNRIPAPPTKYVPSKTLADGQTYLVSQAHPGFTSTWFRSFNGTFERYKSNYEARPKIYKVGGLTEEKIGSLD